MDFTGYKVYFGDSDICISWRIAKKLKAGTKTGEEIESAVHYSRPMELLTVSDRLFRCFVRAMWSFGGNAGGYFIFIIFFRF